MTYRISRHEIHKNIYLLAMALLVCCLPLSRYLTSIAQFIIALNWIMEGNFRKKFSTIQKNPAILLFAFVFLMYAVGCLYSENGNLAVERMKNALPLLLFPIVMGTSVKLDPVKLKYILLLFSAAVIAAAIVCLIVYFQSDQALQTNYRKISVFMPHLRFALLIDMAIAILVYYFLFSFAPLAGISKRTERAALLLPALFLCAFLLFLRSFTGLAILLIILPVIVISFTALLSASAWRVALVLTVIAASTCVALIMITWHLNFTAKPVNISQLPHNTANGNLYYHDTSDCMLENGNYIGLYTCEKEMSKEWNAVSHIPYHDSDLQGQELKGTLKRYLTSKGLRKDSAGIHSLTPFDRLQIEKGIANYRFSQQSGIKQRLYETLWEVKAYLCAGYVNNHTVGQRIAFTSTAIRYIRKHILIGTGTGDVYAVLHQEVKDQALLVDPAWEGKPHNQYLFYMMAFGIPGFLIIIFCWIYPAVEYRAFHKLLFNVFFTIMLISMLTMDTMESYDSMAFFACFYCLLVIGNHEARPGESA